MAMHSIFEIVNGVPNLASFTGNEFLTKQSAYQWRIEHLPKDKKYIILPVY